MLYLKVKLFGYAELSVFDTDKNPNKINITNEYVFKSEGGWLLLKALFAARGRKLEYNELARMLAYSAFPSNRAVEAAVTAAKRIFSSLGFSKEIIIFDGTYCKISSSLAYICDTELACDIARRIKSPSNQKRKFILAKKGFVFCGGDPFGKDFSNPHFSRANLCILNSKAEIIKAYNDCKSAELIYKRSAEHIARLIMCASDAKAEYCNYFSLLSSSFKLQTTQL